MSIFRMVLLLALCVMHIAPAAAQESLIYQGPVPLKLRAETIHLPVSLFAAPAPERSDQIQFHAHTDIAALRPVLLQQLRKLADEKVNRCELRLSVLDAATRLQGSQIVLTAMLQAEIWLCTTLLKTAIGSDSFNLEIGVIPEIRDGRIYLRYGTLSTNGMDETVRAIGGELLIQQLMAEAISRFNGNPRLTGLPDKLQAAGYRYQDVTTGNAQIGINTLRVSIIGPNDLVTLLATLANLR